LIISQNRQTSNFCGQSQPLACQTPENRSVLSIFVTSAPRIVSLVPSITELLLDLGLGAYVVGRTGFCIHPAAGVQAITKVGGTKDVNIRKIKQLAPTHVIVNVDENELPTVQALQQFVPHVIVTHPQSPQDNIALIDQLISMVSSFAINSVAFDAVFLRANQLKSHISSQINSLQNIVWPEQRVLYLIWREPWMTVAQDTYISQMLALIGWQTWPQVLGGNQGAARYPLVSGDEPWLQQVQRVLLSSEPYRFGQTHVQEVQQWLPHAKVQLVDGEMLSWYGSRAARGLAYLRDLSKDGSGMPSTEDSSTSSV
jgi:ABC-type Fe3+-hydroxamate transport system substrate-binding protein